MRIALALLVLAVASPTAAADTKARRLTVLTLDATDRPSTAIAEAVTAALRDPWPTFKVLLLQRKDDARIRKDCSTRLARCLAKAGKSYGLDLVVSGTVERFGASAYHVTLRLVDTWTDRAVGFATVKLSATTWQTDLSGAIGELQSKLGDPRRPSKPLDI
ncbi:MAG TPA: hypothetical protein VIU61_21720 [Kofleriaceae bacterium]